MFKQSERVRTQIDEWMNEWTVGWPRKLLSDLENGGIPEANKGLNNMNDIKDAINIAVPKCDKMYLLHGKCHTHPRILS